MSAKGAHFNVEYVKEFYKISSGEILAGQLKQCMLQHAQSHNTSEWKEPQGSKGKPSRSLWLCLLLARKQLFPVQGSPASGDGQACKKAKKAKRSSSVSFSSEAQACKKARVLKAKVSEVSLDS